MGRPSRHAVAAALSGVLVAGVAAALPAHSTAGVRSVTVPPPGPEDVALEWTQDQTDGSVVDLGQLAVNQPASEAVAVASADDGLLFMAVLGVTEHLDERVLEGFMVDDPVVTPDGSGVTTAVPNRPGNSVTITPFDGETLDVGVFDAATGEPAAGEVGLHVDGLDEVCSQAPTGQIAIQDVGYQDGVLVTLAADFLVSCDEGWRELEGQVRLATDVDQTPLLWFESPGDLWTSYGETQQQQGQMYLTAPGYRVTDVVNATPFEHVHIDVSDEPCYEGSEFCWETYVTSSWLDWGWVATITESPDLPLGRTGYRPAQLRTLDGVLNPTELTWHEQSTEGTGLAINYNRHCPACSEGGRHDLVWWRRSDAGEEWQQLDPSLPEITQLDRLLTDTSTEPGVSYEYRVTNQWYEEYVLTSDAIAAMRLRSPVAIHKDGRAPGQAVPPDFLVGDFDEVVESAQESWATGGRLAQVDAQFTGVGSAMDAATASAADDCFHGYRDQDLNVWRHAGASRYETAVCVSRAMWADHDDARPDVAKAQAVVLARGDRYEDAVSSGPLAAWAEAPLLLTTPGSLRAVVREEIDRVLAPGGLVYLIGGPNALSEEVETELSTAGYLTRRLAGPNRYLTAVEVAEELPSTSNFFFATGQNFPDALGAGTAAAALTLGARETGDYRPFALLLTRDEAMNQEVSAFVEERARQFGGWTLVTAGGQAEQAAADAFGANSLSASFSGANRYDTAAQIAEGIFAQPDSGDLVGLGVGLATGTNFPDALAATPYLAEFAQPLLLARHDGLSTETRDFLHAHAGQGGEPGTDRWIDVFGGESVVDGPTLRVAVRFFQ